MPYSTEYTFYGPADPTHRVRPKLGTLTVDTADLSDAERRQLGRCLADDGAASFVMRTTGGVGTWVAEVRV